MTELTHHLDRTVIIGARPDTVFSFFTESARWAAWWGAGSSIEPRPGGRVLVRYPNGIEASGEVLEIARPSRIVFTFGFASGTPMPPGASRVAIHLEAHPDGTRLSLRHEFAEAAARDQHVQGWRYQLSLFGNVVADIVQADAATRIDRWFGAWSEPDESRRTAILTAIAHDDLQFRDRFGLIDGLADLVPHIAGAQRFMPGVTLTRVGDVRQCQGTALVEWQASSPDGAPRGRGTNVFVLAADGRIQRVTGFWS